MVQYCETLDYKLYNFQNLTQLLFAVWFVLCVFKYETYTELL